MINRGIELMIGDLSPEDPLFALVRKHDATGSRTIC